MATYTYTELENSNQHSQAPASYNEPSNYSDYGALSQPNNDSYDHQRAIIIIAAEDNGESPLTNYKQNNSSSNSIYNFFSNLIQKLDYSDPTLSKVDKKKRYIAALLGVISFLLLVLCTN